MYVCICVYLSLKLYQLGLEQVMPSLLIFLRRPLVYLLLVPAPESRLLFRRLAAEQAE